MSTKSIGDQSRPSSRLSSNGSYTLSDPPITINGKKLDHIPSIEQRDINSLRKSWAEFNYDPPVYTRFSINDLASIGKTSINPSPRTSVDTIRPTHKEPSITNHQPLSGKRRSTFLDKSNSVELRELKEKQYYLIKLDDLMQQYGYVQAPDGIEDWPSSDIKQWYEDALAEVNSNESSSIYYLGFFAATGLVWFICSKFFKYRYSFQLACILVGSFHKFKPYVIQLSKKGKGKTFYTEWHPGVKLAMQFGMTIVVSIVVMWAVSSFASREEKPEITQQRVNEIETLLINYDKHPKDNSGQLNIQAIFTEGFKSMFFSKSPSEPTNQNNEEDDKKVDDELNSFLD